MTRLDGLFNIQNITDDRTSLVKVLFIFYLLISLDTSPNGLLSKQTKKYIDDNKYVHHVLGFLTMLVLITLVGGDVDTRSAIVYAFVGYIWFVFSTKLDIHWSTIIFALLFIGYLFENSTSIRIKEIQNDESLTKDKKTELIAECTNHRTLIVGGIIIVTVTGTLFYSHKKQEQYGGGYDVFAYIFN
jgi:hypothetical protein